MPRQLSNTTNRSAFIPLWEHNGWRLENVPTQIKQFESDFPYGRCSERNTVSEPFHVSRVANPPSTQKVGHADAGEIAYFHVPNLEGVAAPQEIGVGKKRDCDMDPLAAPGRPSKSLV